MKRNIPMIPRGILLTCINELLHYLSGICCDELKLNTNNLEKITKACTRADILLTAGERISDDISKEDEKDIMEFISKIDKSDMPEDVKSMSKDILLPMIIGDERGIS